MEEAKVKGGGGAAPAEGEAGQEEGDQSRAGEEAGPAEEGGGGEVQEGGGGQEGQGGWGEKEEAGGGWEEEADDDAGSERQTSWRRWRWREQQETSRRGEMS